MHELCRHRGKTAIVTGTNSGFGFEVDLALARRGVRVILACRSIERGLLAEPSILKAFPEASVKVLHLDLEDLSPIRVFSETVLGLEQFLDILCNIACLIMCPYGLTIDGFERQFEVNYLGRRAPRILCNKPATLHAFVSVHESFFCSAGRRGCAANDLCCHGSRCKGCQIFRTGCMHGNEG